MFELISISKDFKEGNYFVPYKESIDISGILSLESNRVYNLEFNGIIYCKHKNNLYKNLWMSEDRSFEGYHFLSNYFNIWMFIHIFTLTSWFYTFYIKCFAKKVSFTFKKILIFDDNDLTLSQKNYYKSIGLQLKCGNSIKKFDNFQKIEEGTIKYFERKNKETKEYFERREKMLNKKEPKLLETIGSDDYNAKVYLDEDEKDKDKKIIVIVYRGYNEEKTKYYPINEDFNRTVQIKTDLDEDGSYELEVKVKKFGKPIIYKNHRKKSDDSYNKEEISLPCI